MSFSIYKTFLPKNWLDNRTAKKVMRKVSQSFPYLSPTKICALQHDSVVMNSQLRSELINKQRMIYDKRLARQSLFQNPVDYYKQLINDTKSIQALNCAEYAEIVYMLLKMNGIKNCRLVTMITANNRKIDHTLVEINKKSNKNLILDSWLGIAAKTKKFKSVINKKFSDCFSLVPNEKITFSPLANISLNDNHISALRKEFPEFCLN